MNNTTYMGASSSTTVFISSRRITFVDFGLDSASDSLVVSSLKHLLEV